MTIQPRSASMFLTARKQIGLNQKSTRELRLPTEESTPNTDHSILPLGDGMLKQLNEMPTTKLTYLKMSPS